MRPISITEKGWYVQAMTVLKRDRELTLQVAGRNADVLRVHFATIGEQSTKAGWINLFYMLRYRRLHRLFYSALALGIGVETEDLGGNTLLVRMNDSVGHEPTRSNAQVIQTARRP